MRKGTLSDKETMRAYETGTSIVTICLHEGMTVHGVLGRISRARKDRRNRAPVYWHNRRPQKAPSQLIRSLADLSEAMAYLEQRFR